MVTVKKEWNTFYVSYPVQRFQVMCISMDEVILAVKHYWNLRSAKGKPCHPDCPTCHKIAERRAEDNKRMAKARRMEARRKRIAP